MVLYYRISPLFSYNSQLVNQKLVFFKSKYSVKMTDEECLLIFWKRCLVWEYITSPTRAYGRGIGRTHIFNCEMFITCRNLIILPMLLSFLMQQDDTVCKFRKSVFKVCKIRRHPINWVLLIIWCPPVCIALLRWFHKNWLDVQDDDRLLVRVFI